jgi:IS605 OrfB family transposase
MLIDSMKRAHLAYERLLNRFMPDADEIARLSKLPRMERREAMKPLTAQVIKASRYPHLSNNAKDAIRVDALAQIASTIGLQGEQEDVGLPTVTRINGSKPEYETALEGLIEAADLMDENLFRDELLTTGKMGVIRPLNFVRTGVGNGFMLLRDPDSGRLWTWLNLHGADNRFASSVQVPRVDESRELVDLKTGEFVSFSSKTGERFALEMGHAYHDLDYLHQGEPQTARLYWRRDRNGVPCDDFELHVVFQFIVPKIEPTVWMGVDRGIYNLAAYSVVDENGAAIATDRVSGMDLRFVQRKIAQRTRQAQRRGKIVRDSKRRAHADEAVHVTANALVEAAHEHRAQIVLEDLRNLGAARRRTRIPGTRRSGFNVLLNRTQYEKLKNVLSYKLKLAGLPQPIFVRPAGTSQTCPECGHWSSANRKKTPMADGFQMDTFACVECGHTDDADENAARVIAMKGRWLTNLPKKKSKEEKLADELKFDAYLRDAAERRMGA